MSDGLFCTICGHHKSAHSNWWEGAEECQACLRGEPPAVALRAPLTSPEEAPRPRTLRCSFCGKSKDAVKKFIAGPSVFICNECITLCNEILADSDAEDVAITRAAPAAEPGAGAAGNGPDPKPFQRAVEAADNWVRQNTQPGLNRKGYFDLMAAVVEAHHAALRAGAPGRAAPEPEALAGSYAGEPAIGHRSDAIAWSEADVLRDAMQRLASCENVAPYEAGYISHELAARIEIARRALAEVALREPKP